MVSPLLYDALMMRRARRLLATAPQSCCNNAPGDVVMVSPALSNDAAAAKFSKGFEVMEVPSGKGYLRLTPRAILPPRPAFYLVAARLC
jgi:hypothetical protein